MITINMPVRLLNVKKLLHSKKKKSKLSMIEEKPSEIIFVKNVDYENVTYALINVALKLIDKELLSDDQIFAFFQIIH